MEEIVTTAETAVETVVETVAETVAETIAETVAETTAEVAPMLGNIDFQPMNFVNNLGYMATGMIGIFVVIGVIIVATTVINKAASKKK